MTQRGDIILCTLSGDDSNRRPAVVVQSDIFNEMHASITVCPITFHVINAPLFRITIVLTKNNGFVKDAQIMVDKITTLRSEKIFIKVGELTLAEQKVLDNAIGLWLGLEFHI